jgi:carotenoid cleavage dioxygenase-like enzyme
VDRYRLNPWTLETFGLESLDGAIKPGLPFDLGSSSNNAIMGTFIRLAQQRLGGPAGEAAAAALPPSLLSAGGDAMTAHPHVDPTTGNLVTFTYRVRPAPPSAATGGVPLMATDVTFYELDPATGLPAAGGQASHTLPGFAFVHDFAMTENYYVLFQNPVTVVGWLVGWLVADSWFVPNLFTLVLQRKLTPSR